MASDNLGATLPSEVSKVANGFVDFAGKVVDVINRVRNPAPASASATPAQALDAARNLSTPAVAPAGGYTSPVLLVAGAVALVAIGLLLARR